ncbi:hypothetical protein [Chitinimonas sp.]|uniref:hypothetical protein n=1 Tax=Chitinimonas sp. TaxID=1934313 RepID=UPI002F94CFD3
MTLTIVLPDLRFARQAGFNPLMELALPALATLLGKATRQTLPGSSTEQWLRASFQADAISTALLSLAVDLPNAPPGHWLRADPVHLRADRDRAILFDASLLQIQRDEATALVAALNQLYRDDGYEFVAATPERWYVRLPDVPDLQTSSLSSVSGQDIHAHLPRGPQAMHWHKLLNEWQMLLYTQAVNDVREQAGQPAVNSLWLWGEGQQPPGQLHSAWRQVVADDVLAKGLASLSGAEQRRLPARYTPDIAQEDTLILLDVLSYPTRRGDLHDWRDTLVALERDWFAPLLADWQSGKLPAVRLMLPGHQTSLQADLEPSERWKFWRRPADLASCLAEAA